MKRPPRVKPSIEPLLQSISRRAEGIDPSYTGVRQDNRRQMSNYGNNSNGNNANANNANAGNANANGTNTANTNNNATSQLSNREIKRKCPDPLCRALHNKHQLYRCPGFQSLELEGRRRKVHALGVCDSCLRKQCQPSSCPYKPCQACNEQQNSWLCPQLAKPAVPMPSLKTPLTALASLLSSSQDPKSSSKSPTSNDLGGTTLLATAVINVNDVNGVPISLRALCDNGSHINFITKDAYQRLRLARPPSSTTFHGVGGKESVAMGAVNLEFSSRFNIKNSFFMSALIIKKITSKLPQQGFDVDCWTHLSGLPLADENYNVPNEIDVLLGASVFSDIMKQGLKRGGRGEPIAQCTRIGWIVYGKTEVASTSLNSLHAIAELTKDIDETNVEALLTRFWEIEQVPERHLRSKEEQFCEEHFLQNTTRDENGRYIVKIPINPSAGELGDSRATALRRFLQMEQRFIKHPQLKEKYVNFMRDEV